MKRANLFLLFSFVFYFCIEAQGLQPIPMDTAIRYGKLSNGLTYYIRHNEQPKERAEFFIAQNVGSILEEDSQNGLAHFLEHMCFNGTKHYPGNNLINYFETIGVRFGQNINAYTSLDETVYNLSGVPTTREGILDSALLVLHDWSNCVLLEGSEIDKERGVIREEWRQGNNADRRLWAASNKVTMAGSQYAKRDVIGDTAIINNFSYQTLKDYYKKWYRPDLQAILIVGDINVALMESKIKTLFADIPVPINPAERIYYPVPDNVEPIVGVFTDPEMETTQTNLYFKQNPLPDQVKLSIQGYAIFLVKNLINSMTNKRLDEIKQESETPFVSAFSGIGGLVKTKDVFAFICNPVTGKEQAARERLLKEAEIIKRYGFTSSELDRAKAELLSNYEKSYNERNRQKNNNLIKEYARNFLSAEPIPGIEWEFKFVSDNLSLISIDMVNQLAKSLLGNNNIIYTITGPQKEGLVYPTNEDLKQEIATVQKAELKAYQDSVSNEPLISKKLKPGKVKKANTNETLGTTEWTLSNGIKIIFKPTKFKEDEIRMSAWSDGGLSLLPQQDLPSAILSTSVISQSGLGALNMNELNKRLTGKIASVSPSISGYDEGLNGSSSVKDLETLLQLTNLYFTAPRKDENAYQYVIKYIKTYLENASLNPENAYSDSISMILYGHNPRVILTNLETINKADYQSVQRIYRERFANPADFTFEFVGNIDEKTFKSLVELYLGSLRTTKSREIWKDNNIRIQQGQIYKEIEKTLKVSKTTNYIHYSFNLPYNVKNHVMMRAIGNLLNLRYTATIREEEGGSYGVSVNGYISNKPTETGELVISFDTDPKLGKRMLDIVHAEIKSLVEDGPKTEDLNKVKLNLLKQYKEDTAENSWWISSIASYYRNRLNYCSDYAKAVEAIDSESIKTVVKNMLNQNNRAEILLVPENK
jgi:zinc protease